MTVNIWGTPIDPKTGLPVYPVKTASTEKKLREQAKKVGRLADQLEAKLATATDEFAEGFAAADARATTQARIRAAAKNR